MKRARRAKRVQLIVGIGAVIAMAWRFLSTYGQ